MKLHTLTAILVGILLAGVARAAVVDSVNAGRVPLANTLAVTDIGWYYTPGFSYTLQGVQTKFSSAPDDGRSVTVSIYTTLPAEGGTLLGSASFSPLGNQFSGGAFAGIELQAGEDYFIAFSNVEGLGANFTDEVGAASLGDAQISFDGQSWDPEGGWAQSPILRFDGAIAVPLPASAWGGGALLALATIGRLRRWWRD